MALSPENEAIAAALARKFQAEFGRTLDAATKGRIRAYLYDETDADLSDIPAIENRAKELATAVGAPAKPERQAGGGRKSWRRRDRFDPTIVTAPFRFIELPDDVLAPESDEPIPLDDPLDDGWCGELEVEWIAETPMLVGGASGPKAEKGEDRAAVVPLTLGDATDFVLPGATLRGLIRASCEIVGHARLTQLNAHHRYGVRDFDHAWYMEESGISDVREVRAGFLTLGKAESEAEEKAADANGMVWKIRPAANGGAGWAHVPLKSLTTIGVPQSMVEQGSQDKREFQRNSFAGLDLVTKYRYAGMVDGDGKNATINFTRKTGFVRTQTERDDGREVSPSNTGGEPGIFVFSGSLPGGGNKKFEYAVFPDDKAKPFVVPPDVVDDFNRLYSKQSKNRPVPDGNWKLLKPLAERGEVPVFYVNEPGKSNRQFFFGLTRLFKMPFSNTVGDILDRQPAHMRAYSTKQDNDDGHAQTVLDKIKPDFVENLFGYVVEPKERHAP